MPQYLVVIPEPPWCQLCAIKYVSDQKLGVPDIHNHIQIFLTIYPPNSEPTQFDGKITTHFEWKCAKSSADDFLAKSVWYHQTTQHNQSRNINWEYPQNTVPPKTCDILYISENTLTFLNLIRKILPPQHIVVNPFPDYPTACQPYIE